MCGIIIAQTRAEIKKQFEVQQTRGIQSVGFFDCSTRKRWKVALPDTQYIKSTEPIVTTDTVTKITTTEYPLVIDTDYDQFDSYIEKIETVIAKHTMQGPFVFHHRKASAGSATTENAHPFVYKETNFLIMQNGTDEEMKGRLKVQAMVDDERADKSDTYALGYLINQHPDKKEELIEQAIGVTVIINLKDNFIEIYADGKRPFYRELDAKFFATRDTDGDERTTQGTMFLDFELNRIDFMDPDTKELLEDDREQKKKVTVGYQNTPYTGHLPYHAYENSSAFDGDDDRRQYSHPYSMHTKKKPSNDSKDPIHMIQQNVKQFLAPVAFNNLLYTENKFFASIDVFLKEHALPFFTANQKELEGMTKQSHTHYEGPGTYESKLFETLTNIAEIYEMRYNQALDDIVSDRQLQGHAIHDGIDEALFFHRIQKKQTVHGLTGYLRSCYPLFYFSCRQEIENIITQEKGNIAEIAQEIKLLYAEALPTIELHERF